MKVQAVIFAESWYVWTFGQEKRSGCLQWQIRNLDITIIRQQPFKDIAHIVSQSDFIFFDFLPPSCFDDDIRLVAICSNQQCETSDELPIAKVAHDPLWPSIDAGLIIE
jgi:hypothetical protein